MSQRRGETTTTLKRLIHIMTTDMVTCIVFFVDNFQSKGLDHTRPFYISVIYSSHRVPFILLDNGFALNVCPLTTIVALGFAPLDIGPSTQTARAYNT